MLADEAGIEVSVTAEVAGRSMSVLTPSVAPNSASPG